MRLHRGETAAEGWRPVDLSDLVRSMLPDPRPAGRPSMVAVDGRGGAGKSTLAEHLSRLTPPSVVVHTDDIAWHHGFFDWGQLIADNVLQPIHSGVPVSFRPLAWVERGRDGAIEVPAGLDVVWVEGTGVIRQDLEPWFDATVFIQGDLDEQERRLAARDGDTPEIREFIQRWLAEEIPFMQRERPWDRASVVIDGTSSLPVEPNQVVVATTRSAPAPDR